MTVQPESYAGTGKSEKVASMFDSIASRYDLLNRVLSGGIDKRWRKKVIVCQFHLIKHGSTNRNGMQYYRT